jgi:hypothetical protein
MLELVCVDHCGALTDAFQPRVTHEVMPSGCYRTLRIEWPSISGANTAAVDFGGK